VFTALLQHTDEHTFFDRAERRHTAYTWACKSDSFLMRDAMRFDEHDTIGEDQGRT
jgi:hypothetical protein